MAAGYRHQADRQIHEFGQHALMTEARLRADPSSPLGSTMRYQTLTAVVMVATLLTGPAAGKNPRTPEARA